MQRCHSEGDNIRAEVKLPNNFNIPKHFIQAVGQQVLVEPDFRSENAKMKQEEASPNALMN